MPMKRLYGRAFVRGSIQDDALITIDDGAIVSVEQTREIPRDAERTAALIVPGFIDIHIHGGDGADFMDADERANARILTFHARHGTTATTARSSASNKRARFRATPSVPRRSSFPGSSTSTFTAATAPTSWTPTSARMHASSRSTRATARRR